MIKLRSLRNDDLVDINSIYQEYFSGEFAPPDLTRFICAAVAEENGRIISAGGIRAIPELITITDKSFSARKRVEALLKLLDASIYFGQKFGSDHINTFVQGDTWINQLKKKGFKECKGTALYIR